MNLNSLQTSGSGNIILSATNAAGGVISQPVGGSITAQAITITATNGITLDSVRGTTVALTSNTGGIFSAGALGAAGTPIQASAQLTLSAATGIQVNSLTPLVGMRATNASIDDFVLS